MAPSRKLLTLAARWFNVPPLAVDMVATANALSGLGGAAIPSELVPLNAIQLSRGLLNFAVFQSLEGWVLPYWAERQYDPAGPSFIPRSHLGLSINLTHRNWTAVGVPGSPVTPVVDPRGLVMPRPHGWSIDVWVAAAGHLVIPSRESEAEQEMREDIPIVQTVLGSASGGPRLSLRSFADESALVHRAEVHAGSVGHGGGILAIALRPFNPEGVACLRHLCYDRRERAFLVDDNERVILSSPPDLVVCSRRANGDVFAKFLDLAAGKQVLDLPEAECPDGLAHGMALYRLDATGMASATVDAVVPLAASRSQVTIPSVTAVAERWRSVLEETTGIETPDPVLDRLYRRSLATLHLLTSPQETVPGPFTYRQFWFRDAAMMLLALDRTGSAVRVESVLRGYPQRQESSGFFRSQQGEWDSNGQVLWGVREHVRIHGDGLLETLLPSLEKGARWLVRKTAATEDGLLPPGLSAEHLGLVDRYYWDNLWAVAGLQAFQVMARERGAVDRFLDSATERLTSNLRRSVELACARLHSDAIPAGPARPHDSGMIGTVSALYPLQVLSPEVMIPTLAMLTARYCRDGLFHQRFIHSGANMYLTLQLAHAWLYAGERTTFHRMMRRVIESASSTGVWPEAIHPVTGGGVMGDGHHGWAAAEFVLAVRESVMYERRDERGETTAVVFLAGIPRAWFLGDQNVTVRRMPLGRALLDLNLMSCGGHAELTIRVAEGEIPPGVRWVLRLPFGEVIRSTGIAGIRWCGGEECEAEIAIGGGTFTFEVRD